MHDETRDESPEVNGPASLRRLAGGFSARDRGTVILDPQTVLDVADRLERAERERDAYREIAHEWRDLYEIVKAQRDAPKADPSPLLRGPANLRASGPRA